MNSLQWAVRRGVHHSLDLEDGWERLVLASIVEVRRVRAKENQRFSGLREGDFREEGIWQPSSLAVMLGQSVSCQHGLGRREGGVGGGGEMRIGTW